MWSGEQRRWRELLLLYEIDEGWDGFRAVGELFDWVEPVVQVRHCGTGVLYTDQHMVLQLMHTYMVLQLIHMQYMVLQLMHMQYIVLQLMHTYK